MTHRTALLALLLGCTAAPAFAQSDQIAMAHQSTANQIGLMEYCQGQGFVGADAVAAQRETLTQLPPSNVSTTDAEALGKSGTMLVPGGNNMTMASMAGAHGGTVEAMCKQMAQATQQVNAAMKQHAGAMPSMSGMPAMPSMSGMPSMPTMNGMPAMPGMPPSK